jgi:hypothetical protein
MGKEQGEFWYVKTLEILKTRVKKKMLKFDFK